MGILSNRNRDRKQWTTIKSQCQRQSSNNHSSHGINSNQWRLSNRSSNKFIRLIRSLDYRRLHNLQSRRSISIHPKLFWTRNDQPDDHTTHHGYRISNRYNKYLHSIKRICLILATSVIATPAYAESVGGVSATANPIANSSGSVTNQAIQVLQGPYITNTYGNQISCQGPTFNATPYIQSVSYTHLPLPTNREV